MAISRKQTFSKSSHPYAPPLVPTMSLAKSEYGAVGWRATCNTIEEQMELELCADRRLYLCAAKLQFAETYDHAGWGVHAKTNESQKIFTDMPQHVRSTIHFLWYLRTTGSGYKEQLREKDMDVVLDTLAAMEAIALDIAGHGDEYTHGSEQIPGFHLWVKHNAELLNHGKKYRPTGSNVNKNVPRFVEALETIVNHDRRLKQIQFHNLQSSVKGAFAAHKKHDRYGHDPLLAEIVRKFPQNRG